MSGRGGRVVRWNGPRIAARVASAAAAAIDETTALAARDAAATHWWRGRRGQLERHIVSEPARREGARITGRFGASRKGGFYGLFLERRTPFLRPAADRQFGQLVARIRARL